MLAVTEPGVIRLDSSLPGAAWNYAPGKARLWLRCDPETRRAKLITNRARVVREWRDPLAALEWMTGHWDDTGPGARWVGYLSYDLGRYFEHLPSRAIDDLRLPLFCFTLHDSAAPPATLPEAPSTHRAQGLRSNFTRDAYLAAVAHCINYIAAGDVFQVNLAQRFSVALPADPASIYANLLRETPAWYGALLQYPDLALICNSPEMFLHVLPQPDGSRTVVTRPIKGTRPKRDGLDRELHDSAKDQAELNMIVDLERNDLGRVCEIGSVRVTRPREIESHPTVYHGAATIEGRLRSDVGFVDLLRATFPGGSITGAPKIRAMQIIDELEPHRRGPYCGAIGYLTPGGGMEFNVAIRTMIVKEGLVHVPVGGGIVADSKPADEYEETLVKARAMFTALGIAAEPSS